MKSVNRTIQVRKATNLGVMPLFISMMHRHLEKEKPVGVKTPTASGVNYSLPIDLLSLSIDDQSLLREVASVTLTYRTP